MKKIEDGDLVLIFYRGKRYLKKVVKDKTFTGKGGIVRFSEIIGKPFGIAYGEYEIYYPTIEDIIMYGLKRQTQIIYPKESFFIPLKMDIRYGSKVLEVGAGSGALTIIFSRIVGSKGMVISFEKDERQYQNARRNIELFSDEANVRLFLGEISDFDDMTFDAVFIDIKEPWLYIEKAHKLLKESGSLGIFVPTANQIIETLKSVDKFFGHIEVIEILMRRYKTIAERLRPEDRMIGHTGYLLFGKKLTELRIS